jgi:DNA-binding transcriptional regulator YhcF (GntR family)
MNWQFDNDMPIYSQLVGQIKQRIVAGVFPPGERLPSVRDLATDAGVNPNTMQRALQELERNGLVFSQRTAGRFVTEDHG